MMTRSNRVSARRRRSRCIHGHCTIARRSPRSAIRDVKAPGGLAMTVIETIAQYWNGRIHDLEMKDTPVGTREFFDDLDDYRFDKLHYLPRLVNFNGFGGKELLEV